MSNEIVIKTFEDVLVEFDQKLTDFGSIITNRQAGGAFDLYIRIACLMLADAYAILDLSLQQVFPSTATGDWLDLHAQAVALTRLTAQKALKEFICKRDTDGGVVQIPVGDILKTPVLPARGQLRWFSKAGSVVDLTGTTTSASDDLIDSSADFILDGVEVGSYLFNQTDGSFGVITEVQKTRLVAKLQDGTANTWAVSDSYKTQKPSSVAGEFTTRSATATSADPTGATLTDSGATFVSNSTLKLGQVIYNITDGSSGIVTAFTETTIDAQLTGGTNNDWEIGDDYKLQTDLQITITCEADEGGTEYNQMELLLGRPEEEVEMEIETGFTGVDNVYSTGDDLVAGTDDETDVELRERIAGQWKALARGATKEAYEQFAINSSPTIFDANVFKGTGATDVKIVLSGVAGSRDIADQIGIKVDTSNNFDSLYTDDGTLTGIPRPLGITCHEYIRSRAPLTDIIFLESVTEQKQDIEVNVKVADGFDFETEVKPELQKRLRALFLVEKSVKDVQIVRVGEDLLFSKVTKIVNNTAGVADWVFVTPDPATNDGNIDIDDDKVFSLGAITIGEIT